MTASCRPSPATRRKRADRPGAGSAAKRPRKLHHELRRAAIARRFFLGARPLVRMRHALSRSFFESKFKAPETPPSHGLTGLAAIKLGAKWAARLRGREWRAAL